MPALLLLQAAEAAPAAAGAAEATGLPAGFGLTLAMVAVGVGAGVSVRGLRAPRTRGTAVLGLLLAFVAAAAAVLAALRPESVLLGRLAPAAAALVAGVAHSVYFGFAPLPRSDLLRTTVGRATIRRLGPLAGGLSALALLVPGWTWPAWLAGAAVLAVVASWVATAPGRTPPKEVRRGDAMLPSVRFPCPRCGVVEDWGDAVTPCPECGLFVHVTWDPDDGEPALFAPEDPAPGTFVRFRCIGCLNEVDWMRGTTACAVCGKRLRLNWNVHA